MGLKLCFSALKIILVVVGEGGIYQDDKLNTCLSQSSAGDNPVFPSPVTFSPLGKTLFSLLLKFYQVRKYIWWGSLGLFPTCLTRCILWMALMLRYLWCWPTSCVVGCEFETCQDLDENPSWLTTDEKQFSHFKDITTERTTSLCNLQTKLKAPEYRAEDAENCNNLQIVTLEGGVVRNSAGFVEGLLCSLIPTAQFSHIFTVERVHHVLFNLAQWVFCPVPCFCIYWTSGWGV